ncbi:OpgC domain-containing protein [Rhodobacteraceae bacterium F11138]|nr:OpgC domain-containing protein [Rhodobacteraceae bacterium F11138]
MATISPTTQFLSPPAPQVVAGTQRDPRLDFYRGIAMFIILVAHIPFNPWSGWIPARFGWSDATEIFVFCSGMASAIAFGGSFARRGWGMGAARVMFRVWQVYWAHIGLFFFVAMMMAALDLYGGFEKSYVDALNLGHFFKDPMTQIVGMFTLTYVPNYFDILPMYLVVLAMMPLFMGLAQIDLRLVAGVCLLIWLAATLNLLSLPAESWSDRRWFFNPFGWQLLFFTGFALMRGWLPAPPVSRLLALGCAAFLILTAPFGSWKVFNWIHDGSPALGETLRNAWSLLRAQEDITGFSLRDKTNFGVLRYLHFLALAYLAWIAAGEGGRRLRATGTGAVASVWRLVLKIITKVGQQSLAVFVFSMAIARLLGCVLDQIGRSSATVLAVNLMGFAMIISVAYIAAWFKSQPWRSKRT